MPSCHVRCCHSQVIAPAVGSEGSALEARAAADNGRALVQLLRQPDGDAAERDLQTTGETAWFVFSGVYAALAVASTAPSVWFTECCCCICVVIAGRRQQAGCNEHTCCDPLAPVVSLHISARPVSAMDYTDA